MSWLNELVCLFLLLIMKLAVLWAVTACVAAFDPPCEEYCKCLSTGTQKIAYQPECNCMELMEGQRNHKGQLYESRIYYEPVDYLPASAFGFYDQPFYILNPYVAIRNKHFTHDNKEQRYNPHQPTGTQIEINIDNTHTSHNRREKDTFSDNNKHASIYLDIDLEPDSETTAAFNILTPEDLKRTKERLVECTTLYTVLDYRITKNLKHVSNKSRGPFAKFDYLSDDELIQIIDDKCSQISYILDKSRNEIKDNRPKKTTDTFRTTEGVQPTTKQQRGKPSEETNENSVDNGTVDSHLANDIDEEFRYGSGEYDKNQGHTVIIYAESESNEKPSEKTPTFPPHETTTDLPSTSNYLTDSFLSVSSQNDEDASTTTERLGMAYPDVVAVYDEDEHLYSTETTSLLAAPAIKPTTGTNNANEDSTEDERSTDQELGASDTVRESHPRQVEDETALLKIDTHEYNDTVKSFVNGTEDFVNYEFEDGQNRSVEDLNEVSNDEKTETKSNAVSRDNSDISGNLYFLYKQHRIPARFVQKPNGSLNVGIDGATLCNKLTQDGERKSPLLTTLCNCYKFDNCSSGNGN